MGVSHLRPWRDDNWGRIDRFARHCARYWTIAPRSYPRGVFRFRSLEEAPAARERITRENVARLRTSREAGDRGL